MGVRCLLLFLLVAVAATCSGLNVGGVSLELKIQNDPQCKFEGQQCSADLREIIYCTSKNGNSYVMTTCEGGRVCERNAMTGEVACKTQGPDFPEGPRNSTFTCHGAGFYPDGYRCGIGYMCSSNGEFPDLICECPAGTTITTYPSVKCTADQETYEACGCPYKNRCRDSWNPSDFGEGCFLPGYYYTCQGGPNGVETNVYKCPAGQDFIEGKCRPTAAAVLNASPAMPNQNFKCVPYEAPCLPDPKVTCSKKDQLLPHKVKRCYYYCGGDLKPVVRDCGKGGFFSCEYGQCGCRYNPKP